MQAALGIESLKNTRKTSSQQVYRIVFSWHTSIFSVVVPMTADIWISHMFVHEDLNEFLHIFMKTNEIRMKKKLQLKTMSKDTKC